jgi:hypothetical protein
MLKGDFKILCIFFSLIGLYSCKGNIESNIDIETVKVTQAYENRSVSPISEIAEDIEYIKLESKTEAILNSPYILHRTNDSILIIGYRQVLVFHYPSGRFVSESFKYGRGPGEHSFTSRMFNEKDEILHKAKNHNNYEGFRPDGSLFSSFSIPESVLTDTLKFRVSSLWNIGDGLYIGYVDNLTGHNPVRLVVFNDKGEIVKKYPNYNSFDFDEKSHVIWDPLKGWFFQFQDSVRFFESYTDTIFNLSEKEIIPRYYLEISKNAPPYYIQKIEQYYYDLIHQYIHLLNFRETSRYLFFFLEHNRYRHIAVYDKNTKETNIAEVLSDKEFYRFPEHYAIRSIGFENDIDSFIPVGTGKVFYATRNDELITYSSAYEVKRWFEMNPDKAAKLPYNLKALKPERDEENDILIIVKLKK